MGYEPKLFRFVTPIQENTFCVTQYADIRVFDDQKSYQAKNLPNAEKMDD